MRGHPLRPDALLVEDRRGARVRGLALVRRDLPFHRCPHERMNEPERLVALEDLHRHQLGGGLAGGLDPQVGQPRGPGDADPVSEDRRRAGEVAGGGREPREPQEHDIGDRLRPQSLNASHELRRRNDALR